MKIIIILSVLASLLNDLFVRNIPILSTSTSLIVAVFILFSSIKILRHKKIKDYSGIYLILYLNLLFLITQALFRGLNSDIIKLVLYITTIVMLINYLNKKTMSLLYSCIIAISIVLSIDIIINGLILISKGINLRNLRSYTILDKQGYNMFYSFAIPILLVRAYITKSKRYIIIFIIDFIAVLFFMQIKSFLYTIPVGLILSFLSLRIINIRKFIRMSIIPIIMMIIIITVFPNIIPRQISTAINYYVIKDESKLEYDDYRNLDTFIIRNNIWKNGMEYLKNKPILGIGYGNYAKLVENKKIVSDVTGIVYDTPTVTESGLLTILLEGGILGFIMHMTIIIWIVINTIKIRDINIVSISTTIIFFVFIVSNIVQDNLNYSYWFIIGAQIYISNLDTKSTIVNI